MFELYRVEHVIRTEPQKLNFDFLDCLKYAINRQFSNKIILNVGLCIGLFDFENVGASRIMHVEGCTFTDTVFRLVIFRPFIGEILTGKISQCDNTGAWISMYFFADIFVSVENLPHPSRYIASDSCWIWDYETEDGVAELYLEKGSDVRFKVIDMTFTDVPPLERQSDGDPLGSSTEVRQVEPSFMLYGTMSECGLGCLSWWESNED